MTSRVGSFVSTVPLSGEAHGLLQQSDWPQCAFPGERLQFHGWNTITGEQAAAAGQFDPARTICGWLRVFTFSHWGLERSTSG